jgi:hypothetical protein
MGKVNLWIRAERFAEPQQRVHFLQRTVAIAAMCLGNLSEIALGGTAGIFNSL